MTTTAITIREKADELKTFLHQPDRFANFAAVMPDAVSAKRLLSVVFAAAIKNPKILDCSKASLLNSVMSAAEIGIEPILGRGYLIPYNNSKQVAGKWVKVLECQFQIGWQGLIDLARRSGTIADVYGYNVYANDEFDITFGLNQNLHHRPWYMFPEKKNQGPGEIIGAYCVWVLKDGTKHPEFMPISEIYKRRDASQSYQSAVKYNKESPWSQWPEEMNLKTVIKHSSKMVPASIEFMKAVQYDDASETGITSSYSQFFSGEEVAPAVFDKDKAVLEICKDNEIAKERFDQFLGLVSQKYDSPEDEVIDTIIEDTNGFISEYRKWALTAYPPTLQEQIGKLKTTGLVAWEKDNHCEIADLPKEDKEFFLEKWSRIIGYNYYSAGQPGYQKPIAEMATTEEPPLPVETQGQGQVRPQQSKLQIEFAKAMMEYRDDPEIGIGPEKFNKVMQDHKFSDINSVPEREYGDILQAMEEEGR